MDDLLSRGHLIDATGAPGHEADAAMPEGRVAGAFVIDGGDHPGALPGRVLRRPA